MRPKRDSLCFRRLTDVGHRDKQADCCVTHKACVDGRVVSPPQKLRVVFAVGSGGELSEALEVEALSCDTVDQVKHKILAVFKAKFGFPFNQKPQDIRLGGYQRGLLGLRGVHSEGTFLMPPIAYKGSSLGAIITKHVKA